METKKKAVQRIEEQLMKLEVQATDREENKQIALGTSKLNYLDPRISVAWWDDILDNILTCSWGQGCTSNATMWRTVQNPNVHLLLSPRCKKWGIPVEKIYNKTQREKFAWAIDMAEDDYEF